MQSFVSGPDETEIGRVPWLGLVMIMGALVSSPDGARSRPRPALFVTTFMSALACEKTGVAGALAMGAGLTAICVVIFVWGLGLPLRVIGPWLTF